MGGSFPGGGNFVSLRKYVHTKPSSLGITGGCSSRVRGTVMKVTIYFYTLSEVKKAWRYTIAVPIRLCGMICSHIYKFNSERYMK
jgi:hypothetical protein